MARVFSITGATSSVRVDAKGRAEVSFTVTNTSGRPVNARAEAKAGNPAQQGWLSVADGPERNYPDGGTHQISVIVAVPAGSQPGSYPFRLDVVSTANPDEDFAEGPTVSLEVGTLAPAKKGFPWWIVAAAAVVLVVGGVAAYFLMFKTEPEVQAAVSIPNVVGKQLEQAKFDLAQSNLNVGEIANRLTVGGTTGEVAGQDPPAGKEVPPGTEVKLETAEAGAKVPDDIVGKPIEEAKQLLASAGLKVGGTLLRPATDPAEDNRALEVEPAPGTLVPVDTAVDIHVGMLVIKGAQAPNVVGMNRSDAETRIVEAGLKLGQVELRLSEPGTGGKALEQHPGPRDGTVAADSNVNLTVAEAGVKVPNVVGSVTSAAAGTLRAADLVAKEMSRTLAEGKPQDTILKQSPEPGELVRLGSAVELEVANAGTKVPNVVGFTRDGALSAIQGANLRVKEIPRSSAGQGQGIILDQTPNAGSLVSVNTEVSIGVNALIPVPKIVGLSADSARSALAQANLAAGGQTVREMDSGVTGTVLSQNPAQNSMVARGTPVAFETANVKPKPIGCDGVSGSGKVNDSCGVCGGNNACLTPCPATRITLGNDYVFIYLDLPKTDVGNTHKWSTVAAAQYHFPRCYRVYLDNVSYSCAKTPNGGVWQQAGNVVRDALCHGVGNTNQAYMSVNKR